ncbi:MAG TPA: SirB2 family protein [Mariprofundaceae bacterium]|nr:SirB2 family protein [Mariprofundaceae bacterium]
MPILMLKAFHAGCAGLSLGLFVWRGMRVLRKRPVASRLWGRIVPDGVDMLLLASGVALAWMLRQVPLESPWLTAKLAAVILYIGLGFIVMRLGRTQDVRLAAWVAALVVFAYIVSVAVSRSPLPFLS